MLICSSITAIIGYYIHGWLRYGFTMALIGEFVLSLSVGLTLPIIWSAITILVDKTIRGTAYGVSTAISFGVMAISYVIVGILTNEDDGEIKYINVRVYLLLLIVVSMLFYVVLYIMDIKCNHSILKLKSINKHIIE